MITREHTYKEIDLVNKAVKLVELKLSEEAVKHCDDVAVILEVNRCRVEVVVAGLLHDIIEDSDVTYEYLVKEFGKEIADLVNEVTQEGKKDTHGYYYPRLHSREGIMIKFADRLNNLNRIDEWDEKRKEQYLKRSKFWRSE